ncbi:hypothetical protein R4282_03985 [Rhodococcus oxybenzonivorans]|uniref:hypothetical protein n=1 Tax=Rhodococcus oxybenzonivorans TaxID=1990687 RepID=UPI002952AF82|nr:hypothetical protein [Rhodococcus oxybenzonivorans]MDV7352178.1 hypothetical protein [Rhodococcus oxybenzonivorans]
MGWIEDGDDVLAETICLLKSRLEFVRVVGGGHSFEMSGTKRIFSASIRCSAAPPDSPFAVCAARAVGLHGPPQQLVLLPGGSPTPLSDLVGGRSEVPASSSGGFHASVVVIEKHSVIDERV